MTANIVAITYFEGKDKFFPKWSQEREKYLAPIDDLGDANLREITNNDLIIEFDFNKDYEKGSDFFNLARKEAEDNINKLKNFFKQRGLSYKVTDHKGKSPHFRSNIEGLDDFSKKIASEYRKELVFNLLKELDCSDNLVHVDEGLFYMENVKLIPVEGKQHWKKKWDHNVEEVIDCYVNQSLKVKEETINEIMENQKKVTKNVYDTNNLPRDIKDLDEVMDCKQVLELFKINTKKNPTNHPIHDSASESCLKFDKHTFTCFHSGCEHPKGNYIQLYADLKGYDRIKDFGKAKKELCELKGIKEEPYKIAKAMGSFTNKLDLAKKFCDVQPIFYDKVHNFWVWNFETCCWNMVDDIDILNNLSEQNENIDIIQSKERTEIINSLKQVGRTRHPKDFKNTWIQFKDLVVDIENGSVFQSSPDFFSTNPIPHSLGDSEETPVIDNLIKEWVGEDYVKTMKQIMSYCFLKDYPIHRIFGFLGSGRNGKSRLLALIDRLIGKDNCCTAELDNIMSSRFETYKLYKKLVCLMGETNFNTAKRTSQLKKLSGDDKVSFERKGKDSIDEYNYATILIATNNLPETTDKTEGWYRRWVLIDFPNKFPEGKDILKTIPDYEYNNFCRASINILRELLEEGKFDKEGSIDERKSRYEERSNPFQKFIDENIEFSYDDHINKFEFRDRLKDFSRTNGYREFTDSAIKEKFDEMDIKETRVKADYIDDEGKIPRIRAWKGIRWKKQTIKEEVQKLLKNDK